MTNIQQRVGQMLEDVDEAKKDIKADLSKVREALKDEGVGRHNIFYDENNKDTTYRN